MLLSAKEKVKAGKGHGGCLRGWGLSQGGQRKPHWEGGIWMKAEVMRYWDGCSGKERFQTERKMKSKAQRQDFPGGPVVRALPFHCRGHGVDLWRGWRIRSHMLVQSSQNFFNNKKKSSEAAKGLVCWRKGNRPGKLEWGEQNGGSV